MRGRGLRPTLAACGAIAFAAAIAACAAIAGLDDPADVPTTTASIDAAVVDASDSAAAQDVDASTVSDADATIDAGDPCTDPTLLAYWRLDEGSGSQIGDCSRYMHTGAANGAPAWVAARNGVGRALSFDGTAGQFVDFGTPAALRVTGALTITAWVNVRSVNGAGRILAKGAAQGDRGWSLNFETDGSLRFRIAVDADNLIGTFVAAYARGQWHHVAGVFEPGAALRLYVDGAEVGATTTGIPAVQRDSTQPVRMGNRGDNCCPLDGMLDDVRVYGRALSAAEVKAIAAQ